MRHLVTALLVAALAALPLLEARPAIAAARILVMVESRANPSDAKLLAALDKSGFPYDLYEIAASGRILPEKLFEYVEGLVIRTQPTDASGIGVDEGRLLCDFMWSGGRYFTFGNRCRPEAMPPDSEYQSVLLCRENGSAAASEIAGIPYDLVTHGLNLAVAPGDYVGLAPLDKGEPILRLSGDKFAAIKGQTCSYRVLVTSFQPGAVLDQGALDAFVYKGLDWFFGNQMGIGQVAHDTTITLMDGTADGLYQHLPPADQVVVLEFFATWCSVCARQKPILEEISKEYKDRAAVFAISYRETLGTVEAWLAEHPLPWPVVCDLTGVAAKKYGVKALPTVYVIGRDRKVWYFGNFTEKATLVNEIERCLRAGDEQAKVRDLSRMGHRR